MMEALPLASKRKIEASRQNARLSTGPRTANGKLRSSRNALKHGLSLPLPRTALLAPEALQIVEALLGQREPNQREQLRPYAEEVAAAEMELMRISWVRRALWTELASDDGV